MCARARAQKPSLNRPKQIDIFTLAAVGCAETKYYDRYPIRRHSDAP